MKTLKQIADEIGVTKQAVFYRIKKPPLSNALRSLMSKENGVLTVNFDGETLIKSAFDDKTVKMFDDKEPSKENTSFDGEIIKILQETISTLRGELEIKNRQIDSLTKTVQIQAESINAAHKNELAETIIDAQPMIIPPIMPPTPKKKSFLGMLKAWRSKPNK